MEQLNDLIKALEAGSYNAAPGHLEQGASLQTEDLSPVMENVTFDDSHIKLQKVLKSKDAKSTLIQFNRQLDYGIFGGSAAYEGGIGEEDTSNFVRAIVPMSYYSTVRRVSIAANMISAFDGKKAEDRSAADAAMKLTADIEFDCFRGQSDFNNAGLYDGNPAVAAEMPNMRGVDAQVRESDMLSNTQDLMFAEYGSDQTIVVSVNGAMTQSIIEDAAVKSAMNHGSADRLLTDPISLSQYNKIAHAKERINLVASPAHDTTGADLRRQWTSSALVSLEASRFLSGKTRAARARVGGPASPAAPACVAAANANSSIPAGDYFYGISAVNERGESVVAYSAAAVTVAVGEQVTVPCAVVAGAKYYNVYRSDVGGNVNSCKFIGRIKAGAAAVNFIDWGNRSAGSVTAFLIQQSTMGFHQLAPYSRLKLAVSNLSLPEAYFRFTCLAAYQPRKNVLLENIDGQLS